MSHCDWPVWVIDDKTDGATLERLGDARRIADQLGGDVALMVATAAPIDHVLLIEHGADHVFHCVVDLPGQETLVGAAMDLMSELAPRLVIAPGDADGRQWAGRLAARAGWRFVSPSLLVQGRDEVLHITRLDRSGRLAQSVSIAKHETAVITLRAGVAEPVPRDTTRQGSIEQIQCELKDQPVGVIEDLPADPETVDIRFARRIVSGGRGLGGKRGFETLRRFAGKIDASIAASRMAVDLGWIDYDRQVGQTGKTVAPDLYIACGISGASHHIEGMSDAKHIVAINCDPEAPIFETAHLGLVVDLYPLLEQVQMVLER